MLDAGFLLIVVLFFGAAILVMNRTPTGKKP